MVTIKQIAQEAGVSVMTVSNVLNKVPGKVSPATEMRVREIIEKHHYVRNMAARTLSSKSSHIIGILLPLWYTSPSSLLLNPYAGHLIGYFEEILRDAQYYVMLCSFSRVEEVLTIQRTWHTDGMILMFPHDDEITHELAEKTQSPLVVLDRYFDDLSMLSVSIEDRKGGYIATKHLLEEGHRDIGFAGPSIGTSSVIQNRYQGYLDALKEYHIEPNPHWIFDKVMRLEGGVETAEKLLKMRRRPTAMFTTEDIIACGIMKGYQNHGLHLPEDISLVGFDNSMPSTVVTPMLTSVNQFIRKKAETAVSMLLKAIQDPEYRKDQVVIGVDLVKRDSVLHIAPTD